MENPNLIAKSYSGAFCDFCDSINANVFMTSHSSREGRLQEGRFTVVNQPKPSFGKSGAAFHMSEVLHGVRLFWSAFRFQADVALIHSDSTHFFVLWLFRLAGIKVIPSLHNTLWPSGFPNTGLLRRLIRLLDASFFRKGAYCILGVSAECLRQVMEISGIESDDRRLIEIRGQFSRSYISTIKAHPAHNIRPFRMMFSGRMIESKGIWDITEVAEAIEKADPGLVHWEICGDGPELMTFAESIQRRGLDKVIEVHGHVGPEKMRDVISRSHAAIVPTKSTFAEGMALSAVEPVLTGRPVITCHVVPASEALHGACIVVATDDVSAYVEAVLSLAKSKELYEKLSQACEGVKEQFLDGSMGLSAGLKKAFDRMII
jgi:glycosyltransferase involved in cell wall biosynthesis